MRGTSSACKIWAFTLSFGIGLARFAYAEEAALPTENPWTLDINTKIKASVLRSSESNASRSLGAELQAGYSWASGQVIDLDLVGSKQLTQDELWIFSRATLSNTSSFDILPALAGQVGVAYELPVNKDTLRYDDFRGALGTFGGVTYRLNSGEHSVKLNAQFSLDRNFYAYSSNQGGTPLPREAITQLYRLVYSYRKVWVASISFTDSIARDFSGERFDDEYSLVESLAYRWDSQWNFQVGHTNNGNTFDYNGVAGNVKAYDRDTSQVYLGVQYSVF